MSADLDQSHDQVTAAAPAQANAAALDGDELAIFVARYFRLDEKGRRREYVRTRSGREIPILNEDDAEHFEKNCPYDPDL